jgi:ATP synthase protein I
MNKEDRKYHDAFKDSVREQESRKVEAEKRPGQSPWMGLGMFGMIGWSVSVPTLLGVALGTWLDKNHPQAFSWTLSLLLAGLLIGCLIAWNWVAKENRQMHSKDGHDE